MLSHLTSTGSNLLSTTCNLAGTTLTLLNKGIDQLNESLITLTDLENNEESTKKSFNTISKSPNTLTIILTKPIPNTDLTDKVQQIKDHLKVQDLTVLTINNKFIKPVLNLGLPVTIYPKTDSNLNLILNQADVIAVISDNNQLKDKIVNTYTNKLIFK